MKNNRLDGLVIVKSYRSYSYELGFWATVIAYSVMMFV